MAGRRVGRKPRILRQSVSAFPPALALTVDERRLAEVVRASLDRLLNSADWATFVRAIDRGDTPNALGAFDWATFEGDLSHSVDLLRREFMGGANVQAGKLGTVFDVANPRAQWWAESRTAALVSDISASARTAIQEAVWRGIAEGRPVAQVASTIRSVVGLTPRLATAVERYGAGLQAAGRAEPEIARLTDEYGSRLRDYRAKTIAQTEMSMARSQGKAEAVRQAIWAGALPGNTARQWVASPDELVCPVCGPLDGETVPFDQPFPGGYGDPPLHPNCRCEVESVPALESSVA